jgi:Na+/H+ antiporter NhaD/arsenite permease-like protein
MMVMVEGMGEAGFFDWMCLRLAKTVNYKPAPLFVAFMILSAVLSMFIDSITVILFLAVASVRLAHLLKFDPVPFIISQVFAANLGGSATMSGDPPNIIIGTSLGFSFFDFLTNTGVCAAICLVFTIFFLYFAFRKELVTANGEAVDISKLPSPASAITNKKDFIVSTLIFALAVILLVTHSITHLTVATIGLGIAVITLLTAGKNALELIKKTDYKTLVFFIGLFIVVGGLEETGILEYIAEFGQ